MGSVNPTRPTTSQWVYGVGMGNGSGAQSTPAGTTAAVAIDVDLLPLQPGTYTINSAQAVCGIWSGTNVTYAALCIWSVSGTTWTKVYEFDVTSQKPETWTNKTFTIGTDVTLTAGTYYYGWVRVCPGGHTAGQPVLMRMNAGQGAPGGYRFTLAGGSAYDTFDTSAAAASNLDTMLGLLTFTTSARTIFSRQAASGGRYIVPRCISATNYQVKLEGFRVADGATCSMTMGDNAGGNATTTNTLTLDMGATNQLTISATTLALAVADTGATFDMGIEYRIPSGKLDLFYQNTDAADQSNKGIRSHACGSAAARDSEYAIGTYATLYAFGAGALNYPVVKVGWEALVIFGDSQSTYSTQLLGYGFATHLTYPRIIWSASVSGNYLTNNTSNTAGYLRFLHSTPGSGDIGEMKGIVFLFGGMAINDIVGRMTTEALADSVMGEYASRFGTILSALATKGNIGMICGLPPYSGASKTNINCAAIQRMNALLMGYAKACRMTAYNPWYAMVLAGTESAAQPTFNTAYANVDGLHYNTTGADLAGAAAATMFEAATTWEHPAAASVLSGVARGGADGVTGTDVGASAQLATDQAAAAANATNIKKGVTVLGTTGTFNPSARGSVGIAL